MHLPYNHPDALAFLKEVKRKYKPDKIVCIGDEIDGHSISFHTSDPDLLSPADELKLSVKLLKQFTKLFPEVDVLESNHGSLVYRKGKEIGLPRHVFKCYRDILEAPKGWKWHDKLVLKSSDGRMNYFCHNRSKNVLSNSKNVSMNFIQGHHHSTFDIQYWANELDLYWGMTVGCLIDKSSLAFAYGKTTKDKPIVGVGMIIDGLPFLIPMRLGRNGRMIK